MPAPTPAPKPAVAAAAAGGQPKPKPKPRAAVGEGLRPHQPYIPGLKYRDIPQTLRPLLHN